MDKSELFIKQCDWYNIQEWVAELPHGYCHNGQITYPFIANSQIEGIDPLFSEQVGELIYLPTQDQIQEKLLDDADWVKWALGIDEDESPFELLFYRIMKNLPQVKFSSGEQLWLAFYMYEKHSKSWDGEKWVK